MSTPVKGSSGNASISSGPINGSFPIDRLHECASYIQLYHECLSRNNNYAPMCKKETRDYLICRKERGLMTSRDFRDADVVEDWIANPTTKHSNTMRDFEEWRRKKEINNRLNPNASL